jgi:hypothetical protein
VAGAGVFTGSGGVVRGNRAGGVRSVVAGGTAGLTVDLGAGVMEGGVALTGMVGEGRTLGEGETIAFGVAVAAGVVAEADGAIAGVAEGDAATVGAMEAEALGVAVGDGRLLAVGDAAGVALAAAVAAAAGVAVGATTAVAAGVAAGVEVAAAVAGAVDAGEVVAGPVVVSAGFTNFFGGALVGGVASARILLRARSAAARSAIAVQPVSIVTSTTRSLTVRGRGISDTSTLAGTDTSSSSPRTVAENSASVRDCRRSR